MKLIHLLIGVTSILSSVNSLSKDSNYSFKIGGLYRLQQDVLGKSEVNLSPYINLKYKAITIKGNKLNLSISENISFEIRNNECESYNYDINGSVWGGVILRNRYNYGILSLSFVSDIERESKGNKSSAEFKTGERFNYFSISISSKVEILDTNASKYYFPFANLSDRHLKIFEFSGSGYYHLGTQNTLVNRLKLRKLEGHRSISLGLGYIYIF